MLGFLDYISFLGVINIEFFLIGIKGGLLIRGITTDCLTSNWGTFNFIKTLLFLLLSGLFVGVLSSNNNWNGDYKSFSHGCLSTSYNLILLV